MAAENFWGNLKEQAEGIRTPALVLKEQAEQLAKLTHFALYGQVDTKAEHGAVHHDLDVRVPALNDYIVTIVQCSHPISLYPADIESSYSGIKRTGCQNADELATALKAHLQSEGVQKVLTSLLAQAKK